MRVIEGHQGRLTARGVNISMEAWKVKVTSTEIPANDFESRMRKQAHGLIGAEIEFSGYFDVDNNPYNDAGGGLRSGQTIQCTCYLIKGGLAFTFSFLDVFESEVGDELEGRVQITCRGKSNGVFTYPGGLTSLS